MQVCPACSDGVYRIFWQKKTIDRIGELKTLIGAQFIGGLALLIFFVVSKQNIPVLTIRSIVYLCLLSILDAAGYLFIYKSFRKGIVSVVSPINASAAGLTSIIAVLFFHEKLSVFGGLGLLAIFSGILILSTDFNNLSESFSKKNFSNGVFEALASMVIVGIWFALWDRFVQSGSFLFWLIALKMMMSIFLTIYFWVISKGEKLLSGYKSTMKILFWVAILDAAAYLGTTWGYASTFNYTGLITLVANAYSVPTIILAYFLLKERISKQQVVGVAIIIAGIVMNSIK